MHPSRSRRLRLIARRRDPGFSVVPVSIDSDAAAAQRFIDRLGLRGCWSLSLTTGRDAGGTRPSLVRLFRDLEPIIPVRRSCCDMVGKQGESTMLKKLTFVALAGVAILSAAPAVAQYYDRYDRPPPGYGYDRPRYDYDRPYGGGGRRFGDTCVTSRGSCGASAPRGSRCRCFIEGFGPKRGNVF